MEANAKLVKRCPKCGEIALEVDLKKGVLRCTKCGYEVKLAKWK